MGTLQRVPIKIFRLKQVNQGVTDNAASKFLQGVTTNDIVIQSNKEYIAASQTPPGQPLGASEFTRVLTKDDGTRYVILGDGNEYKIKSTAFQRANNTVDDTFEFYVNPQRLSPVYNKIQTEIRTRGGWEVQHWGNALTELNVEGHSGGMHREVFSPTYTQRTMENFTTNPSITSDITSSTAWKRLVQLKQLYDNDHSIRNQEQLILLGLAIYDSFYIGYFTRFSGPDQSADKPYIFNYSFTMKILQEGTVSSLAPSLESTAASGVVSGNEVNII